MKTNYTIKNFRAFDRKGAQIEFSPLTFLVGCNSSGKSSIVKSLFLLREFFGLKMPIMESTIDFSKYPINTLGTFGNAVHLSSKDKTISVSYEKHSVYLNENVVVSLAICEGTLGNGHISNIKIEKLDGTVLFDVSNGFFMAADTLKNSFKHFLAAASYNSLSAYKALNGLFNETEQTVIADKLERLKQNAIQYCGEDYLDDVNNLKAIPSFEDEKHAYGKFLETDILMFFSVLDELKDVNDPDMIRAIFRSKVIDNHILNEDKRSVIFSYIDAVCQDYSQSHKKDFINYYKSLEDDFINYDAPRFLGTIKSEDDLHYYSDLFQIFPEFVSGQIEQVEFNISCGIPFDRASGISFYDIIDRFGSVHGLLAYLSPENPYSHNSKGGETARHPFYLGTFKEYIQVLIKDILRTDVTESLDYISSSRIQVRRMYPMEDNTEFTSSVKKYYDIRNKFLSLQPPITVRVESVGKWGELLSSKQVRITDFMPGSFMNKWVKAFKIGDRLSLEMDKNGLGLLVKLFNSPSEKKGKLLADVGYGVTQFLSIVLQIETTIMSSLYDCFKGKTDNAISGIPVVPARTIAIEEPEIHLHPKYQSLLAEMFYEAYKEYNIQFIIETHSEYLLRKVQTLVGAKNLSPEEVSMIYVEDDEEVRKGSKKVRRIPVKEDGRLAAPFGPGFYDEADNLSLELFTNMDR